MGRLMTAAQPPASLAVFPVRILQEGSVVYRSHAADRGAGWRSSIPNTIDPGGGRFDLASPQGTLYAADDVETAVREKVREAAWVSQAVSDKMAAGFNVAVITVEHKASCADISSREAAGFGATRQLESEEDYTITHAWAGAFAKAGMQGVRYGSRFTSGPARAWATFGIEGTCGLKVSREIPGTVACAQAGLRVLAPIRRAKDVTII
jgi:hypothetical protein